MYIAEERELKTEGDKAKLKGDAIMRMFYRFTDEQIDKADSYQVVATNMNDAGEDYTEGRLLCGQLVIASKKVAGF